VQKTSVRNSASLPRSPDKTISLTDILIGNRWVNNGWARSYSSILSNAWDWRCNGIRVRWICWSYIRRARLNGRPHISVFRDRNWHCHYHWNRNGNGNGNGHGHRNRNADRYRCGYWRRDGHCNRDGHWFWPRWWHHRHWFWFWRR
jgi:hypothetical protein